MAVGAPGGDLGWGVVAVDGLEGRGSDGFPVGEGLPEFAARGVGLEHVDVHVFVRLADAAQAKGSGGMGFGVCCGESWVGGCSWA